MFIGFTRQRTMATWLTCLLFVSLVLAACGGADESASEEPAASGETEEVAQTAAENEEQAQESQEAASAEEEVSAAEETEATNEEVAAEEEVEATDNENLLAPEQELASSGPAMCRTVTADNDPIVAALQPNELIAPVSDDDWTKGPTDASITVIEYGDFQ